MPSVGTIVGEHKSPVHTHLLLILSLTQKWIILKLFKWLLISSSCFICSKGVMQC